MRWNLASGQVGFERRINPVAGEDYRTIVFKMNTMLRVQVPSLRKAVEYGP